MDRNPNSFVGQLLTDILLVVMLAVVTGLMAVRAVVRGARDIGLLPPKADSVVC